MASTPPLRMLKGLSSAPMEASPDHCSYARNMVERGGKLLARPGMKVFDSTLGYMSFSGVYFGVGTVVGVQPGAVAATVAAVDGVQLYIGFPVRPYRYAVTGYPAYHFSTQNKYTARATLLHGMPHEVWNGSAWVTVNVGDTFQPTPSCPTPFAIRMSQCTSAAAPASCELISAVIDPSATWASSTIGGQTKFWVRITSTLFGATAGSFTGVNLPGGVSYTTTENRIKCVLRFRDRAGAPHTFVAYQYGEDGKEMRYGLDGGLVAVGDSLQPDGSAAVFSNGQVVTAHYHRSSDRIIGCIDGFNWFYMVPSELVIYALVPDDQAVDTPYAGLVDGLRSAIPSAACTAIYDDRLWSLQGNILTYSAPGVFADIWSNGFEIALGDAGGPGTGLCVVGGVLAVFKRNSIYVVQAAGGADEYTAFQIPGNVGCVAPRGVYASDDVAWFPGEDGIYTFNGAELAKVSDKVDRWWSDTANRGSLENAIGVFSAENDEYRLYYPGQFGETNTCESAIYVGTRGPDEAIWPQGPGSAGQYGFQATAVCVDQTTPRERILLGDRYGVIWEMERGEYDGAEPRSAEIVSARINMGTAMKALARWVTLALDAVQDIEVTVDVWGNDQESTLQTNALPARGDMPAASFLAAVALDGTELVPYSQDTQTLPSCPVEVYGRTFKVRISVPDAGKFQMEAMEFEFNPSGRRG